MLTRGGVAVQVKARRLVWRWLRGSLVPRSLLAYALWRREWVPATVKRRFRVATPDPVVVVPSGRRTQGVWPTVKEFVRLGGGPR